MAFTKRRKQPHLYRDRSIDPTKQVRLELAQAAQPVQTAPKKSRKR